MFAKEQPFSPFISGESTNRVYGRAVKRTIAQNSPTRVTVKKL